MLKCLLKPVLRKPLYYPMTFPRAFSTSKCIFASYYDVLKVNPNATQKEIKEAYFKLSKKNHPDLNQNDPGCHDRFVKLQEAYQVLGNPTTRKEYDMKSGGGRREAYYHRDARYKPDFSARDEWIRQQNERMEREMKFGEQFGQRYDDTRNFNSFYGKPHNMTPEEMRVYLKSKRIAGHFSSMNFVIACFFFFVVIIMSESYYVGTLRQKYYEENVRRNAQILQQHKDDYYENRSWEARNKLIRDMEEYEARQKSMRDLKEPEAKAAFDEECSLQYVTPPPTGAQKSLSLLSSLLSAMLKCVLNHVLRKSLCIPVITRRVFSTSKCMCANYYEVLNVQPNATQKEIKEAYLELSKQNHPDLNPNDPGCHNRFVKLQEAYQVLGNSSTRKEYDMKTGRTREEYYYHRDARQKSNFSATRDEWIRRQNEKMEREMKFGEQFGQRFDDPFYNKTYYMTPEEFRIFSIRKKMFGRFNNMRNMILLSGFFIFITVIISESFLLISDDTTEENIRKNAQLMREYQDQYYFGQTYGTRNKLMSDLEKYEKKADEEKK
ncbi:uncharacterized protein LOC135835182 [Planococcus citri]|uniref:uncharacterized protein LOC135835182 n=1 Tax=Planococcus citri TaxID=170843 RepID=UPI0031F9FB0A